MIQVFRRRCVYFISIAFFVVAPFIGCDTAYSYDIEDGIDDNFADSANVTVDTEGGIDISMYEKARVFPGIVDTVHEELINASIEIDLNKTYIDPIAIGVLGVPKNIYSTGLYANAGTEVIITVEGDVNGLEVIIGPHMQDLSSLDPYQRLPIVSMKRMLFPGDNFVKNPMGGLIWIEKNEKLNLTGSCRLSFERVYRTADFIVGETSAQEWKQKVMNTTVPWLEIRGKHFVFTLPKDRINANIEKISSEIEDLVAFWDETISNYFYKYYGLMPGGSIENGQRAPEFPIRVLTDVLLQDNLYLMNTDEAIITINSDYMISEMLDLSIVRSGRSHALTKAIGNMFNYRNMKNPWPESLVQVANAIPLYRMGEKGFAYEKTFGELFPDEDNITTMFPQALSYVRADSSKWFGNDEATRLDWWTDPYKSFKLLGVVQLANYHRNNWDFMRNMNLVAKNKLIIDNKGLLGQLNFFKEICDYFEQDFSPLYDRWGIDLPDTIRTYASKEKQYPLMDEEIWHYNPLATDPFANVVAFDKSKYPRRHDRRKWEAKAFDKDYNDDNHINNHDYDSRYKPENIIDGDKGSYWESYFKSTYIEGTQDPAEYEYETYDFPYYIIVKPDEPINIDGIYLANGSERYFNMDGVRVEYINSGVDPYSDDVAWQILTSLGWSKYDARLKNERFYDVPKTDGVTAIRLVIDKPNTIEFDEEADPVRVEHESKRHSIAEFGTFYYSSN